jgi:hypothetical protein
MDQDTQDKITAGAVGLGLVIIGIYQYTIGNNAGAYFFSAIGLALVVTPHLADIIYERFFQ